MPKLAIHIATLLFLINFAFGNDTINITAKHCHGQEPIVRIDSVLYLSPPLLYSLNGSNFQDTLDFSSLEYGKHTLRVLDSNQILALKQFIFYPSEKIEVDVQISEDGYCDQLLEADIYCRGGYQSLVTLLNGDSIEPGHHRLKFGRNRIYSLDSMGCRVDTVIEIASNCLTIFTGISPNNDGLNDKWIIKNTEIYPDLYIKVYNRFGQMVFKSEGDYSPWDGKHLNTIVQNGSYIYVIQPHGKNSADNMQKGYLNVLR